MFVKICGITRLVDAEAAVEYGAQALGFVFWPNSPRCVDPDSARTIVRVLPPFVTPVGVFVNQAAAEVNRVAAFVGLGVVQLHGDETLAYAARMKRPVVKAFPVGASTREDDLDAWPAQVTPLLDVMDLVLRGGTGQVVDWTKAATLAARRPTLLAGGLRPENVADAIARVRPFGIDVSSGVESTSGVKDLGRLRALFDAIAGERDPLRAARVPSRGDRTLRIR